MSFTYIVPKNKINLKDNIGRTLLHVACTKGNLRELEILIEQGADIEARDSNGNTPLNLASGLGRIELVSFLIKSGADVFSENIFGKSTFYREIERNDRSITGLLDMNMGGKATKSARSVK